MASREEWKELKDSAIGAVIGIIVGGLIGYITAAKQMSKMTQHEMQLEAQAHGAGTFVSIGEGVVPEFQWFPAEYHEHRARAKLISEGYSK